MYPMSPYGPAMADTYGQDAHYGIPMLMQRLAAMRGMQNGGAMPPMQMPAFHTGGPMQQNPNTGIVPPNVLTGGAYPAQQAMGMRTGGGMPPQQMQMPQNRLGTGYNFGMGGLLR